MRAIPGSEPGPAVFAKAAGTGQEFKDWPWPAFSDLGSAISGQRPVGSGEW